VRSQGWRSYEECDRQMEDFQRRKRGIRVGDGNGDVYKWEEGGEVAVSFIYSYTYLTRSLRLSRQQATDKQLPAESKCRRRKFEHDLTLHHLWGGVKSVGRGGKGGAGLDPANLESIKSHISRRGQDCHVFRP
jgi:hypothetical protein